MNCRMAARGGEPLSPHGAKPRAIPQSHSRAASAAEDFYAAGDTMGTQSSNPR